MYHIGQYKSQERSFDWIKDNIESSSYRQWDFSDRNVAELEERRGLKSYLLPLFFLLLFSSLLFFLPSHIALTVGDPLSSQPHHYVRSQWWASRGRWEGGLPLTLTLA